MSQYTAMGRSKKRSVERMTLEDAQELIRKQGPHESGLWLECVNIEEWPIIKDTWPRLACLKPYVMTAIYAEQNIRFMKSISTPEHASQAFRAMGFHGIWVDEFTQRLFTVSHKYEWLGALGLCLINKPHLTKTISIFDSQAILEIYRKYGDKDAVYEYASLFASNNRRLILGRPSRAPKRPVFRVKRLF